MPQNTASSNELDASNLFTVNGLVAVVTGGGTGIGLMIAQGLAANGAKVYIIGRREDVIKDAAKQNSTQYAGSIVPIQGDIGSKSSIEAIVRQIQEKESHINILVNNAGIPGPRHEEAEGSATEVHKKLYDSQDFDGWRSVWDTNVSAVYFTTLAFLPLLEAGGKSTKDYSSNVIVISSIGGLMKKSQGHMAYNATKAASIHMTKMMASEFSSLRIRFNTIAPGIFPSELSSDGSDEKETTEDSENMDIPAGRAGDVKEMAGTVLYLASRAGVYTNGVVIPVDGGWMLEQPGTY